MSPWPRVAPTLSPGASSGYPKVLDCPEDRDLASQQSVEVQVDPELLRGPLETVRQVQADEAVENASAQPDPVE